MTRLVTFLAIVLLQSVFKVEGQLPGNAANVCPANWIPYNNNCYKFYTNRLVTQSSAQAECNRNDASLLRISSQDELNWVVNSSKSFPSAGYWTDLNDNPKGTGNTLGTNVWLWGMYTNADMSLIQWNKIPANDGQSNCAGITIKGQLTDLDCNSKQGYICSFDAPDGCPFAALGWIGESGRCYWVGNTSDPTQQMTFSAAKTFCSKKYTGASLMVINDQNDLSFLSDEIQFMASSPVAHWVDLSYSNGAWASSKGAPTVDLSKLWAGQEPTNVGGTENCGVLRMSGRFSDRGCSTTANFVCKTTQYMYSPTDNIGCGPWIRAGHFCYSFRTQGKKLNWQQARSSCQQKGGDLLKLDAIDKKTWLYQQLLDPALNRVFWTGLNDQSSEGTYVWADGTAIDPNIVNWNQEPNDYKGSEDCAVIYNGGQYNDVSCGNHAAAICELDNQASGCPQGWTANAGNCYLFTPYGNTTQLYTNAEAINFCSHFGYNRTNMGTLLSIDSQAEMTFINGVLAKMSENIYGWYTSLNDKSVEGLWSYSSGTSDPKLIQWKGEPSTKTGDNCGMLNWNGALHMRDCTKTIPYICERFATGYSSASSINGMVGVLVATTTFIIGRFV